MFRPTDVPSRAQSRRRFTLPPVILSGAAANRIENSPVRLGQDRPKEDFRGEGQASTFRKLRSIKYNMAFNDRRRRARETDRIGLAGCTTNREGR